MVFESCLDPSAYADRRRGGSGPPSVLDGDGLPGTHPGGVNGKLLITCRNRRLQYGQPVSVVKPKHVRRDTLTHSVGFTQLVIDADPHHSLLSAFIFSPTVRRSPRDHAFQGTFLMYLPASTRSWVPVI